VPEISRGDAAQHGRLSTLLNLGDINYGLLLPILLYGVIDQDARSSGRTKGPRRQGIPAQRPRG
jgi:hypothetical protein